MALEDPAEQLDTESWMQKKDLKNWKFTSFDRSRTTPAYHLQNKARPLTAQGCQRTNCNAADLMCPATQPEVPLGPHWQSYFTSINIFCTITHSVHKSSDKVTYYEQFMIGYRGNKNAATREKRHSKNYRMFPLYRKPLKPKEEKKITEAKNQSTASVPSQKTADLSWMQPRSSCFPIPENQQGRGGSTVSLLSSPLPLHSPSTWCQHFLTSFLTASKQNPQKLQLQHSPLFSGNHAGAHAAEETTEFGCSPTTAAAATSILSQYTPSDCKEVQPSTMIPEF
ncbi:hypothetical protein Anapl_03961 [Anas platyrhynchos]|uniref:Uncharacterized protein n=1 Tax=Anas platyrhynchos TaxID=8839 RepID=R0KEX2_ANAPL|nr:hypothetical protein Anapl_03961 [Anas platyrhynchos]